MKTLYTNDFGTWRTSAWHHTHCQCGRKTHHGVASSRPTPRGLHTAVWRALTPRYLFKCFIVLLAALAVTPEMHARKKVAVVLSGGGAKGMAHVGALKVIERVGIPVDMIVGTSMGAIVGGLYAVGYTPEQLDSLTMRENWMLIATDKTPSDEENLATRMQKEQYVLSLPFLERPKDAITGGIIRGRNASEMLWRLTPNHHDSISFNHLPIPFACVSQDVATGDEVVHRSGVLAVALRASMSLPGIFAPVYTDNRILVDGGIVNNYPVDVARKMGADIVIGVDVQDSLKSAKELHNDVISQLSQLIDLQSKDRWLNNIKNSDVYIQVDVKPYKTASFGREALDTLINRGQQAAEKHLESLQHIKEQLGDVSTSWPTRPQIELPTKSIPARGKKQQETFDLLVGKAPTNALNLGVRYDNEQLAALLFNTQFQVPKWKRQAFQFSLRLGQLTLGRLNYDLSLGRQWHLSAFYELSYNDFNIYNRGERVSEISYLRNMGEVAFIKAWKRATLNLFGSYQNYDYGSFLYKFVGSPMADIHTESYFKFGARWRFRTLNDTYFATRGHDLRAEYYYGLATSAHYRPFHTVSGEWKAAYSPIKRFTLLPAVYGRYITTENTVAEENTFGGQEKGKYYEQQIPFYGVNRFEVGRRALFVASLEARQHIGHKHYVSLVGNYGMTSDTWSRFFRHCWGKNDENGFDMWGVALKYDLRTVIGPLGLTLHYSSHTRNVDGYVRAGFNF